MSPTARSLAVLRKEGWTAQVVERFNPGARVRQDLFGVIDIVAMKPGTILGVQATTSSNVSARMAKIQAEPRMETWKSAALLEVWGWAKRGPRGKRKVWTLTRTPA